MYWRCFVRDSCNLTFLSSSNLDLILIYKEQLRLIHLPKSNDIDVREVVGKIRVRARNHPNERPAQIVAEELQGIQN